MTILLLAGLAAGLLHVLSGPDHLAAIAPIAVKKPRGAWRAGLRWGFGHASGVIVVGIVSLFLRGALPVDLISAWSDRVVGVLLIGIGLWAIRKALQVHTHEHEHGHEEHVHIHIHGKKAHADPEAHLHTHTAFGIGTLHGLSGSSHFLAIIPARALPSNTFAVIYLAAYGVGTVAAMIGFSHVIGCLTDRFALNSATVYRRMMFGCAALAIGIGGAWLAGFSF